MKIRGGTPDFSKPSLCLSCRHAQIYRDNTDVETTLCRAGVDMLPLRILHPIIDCSEYDDRQTPSLAQMDRIAWKFSVDNTNKPMGFMTPKKWKEKHGDDE